MRRLLSIPHRRSSLRMLARPGLALLLVLPLAGCLLYFDDGGKSCEFVGDEAPEVDIIAAQRNPETLTCETFGGGGCNPECGPCPALAAHSNEAALQRPIETAPVPSWGFCGSPCEGLDEVSCSENLDCRVVKNVRCAIEGNCLTDYIGCFPTDQLVDRSIDCGSADAQACSMNPQCTAFHRTDACLSQECPLAFVLCMADGATPGRCFDPVACDAPTPPCPSGTTPGIADGCFTGACIPFDLCEAGPPEPQPQQ